MRNAAIIFLLIFSAFSPRVQSQGFEFPANRNSITVPIKVNHNLVIVPLSINGSPPLDFILDTGVKTTILTEPVIATLLDLDLTERILIYGLGGEGFIEALRARGVSLDLHGITGSDMDLIVLPEKLISFSEMFGFPVYGIIGYDFFKHFPVQINYLNRRARIYREPTYRIGRRMQQIPLELVDGKPYINARIKSHQGEIVATRLLIDLGASHPVYLNREYIGMVEKTLRGFLGKGISGLLIGEMGRLNKLVLGDVEIEGPLAAFPDREFLTLRNREIPWEGIIGGDVLSRFDLIIDYPSQLLVLRPTRKLRDPFNFNPSGLEVIAGGDDFRTFSVLHVRPGSPSYEAGIEAGDTILRINNLEYNRLTLEMLQKMLSDEPSQQINMVIKRDNKIYNKRFRLRDDL